jgi:hypothetical protein
VGGAGAVGSGEGAALLRNGWTDCSGTGGRLGPEYAGETASALEDEEFATLEWVWWFNYHRLLEPIGYVSPVEYEEAYYHALEAQAEGDTRNSPGLSKAGAVHSLCSTCLERVQKKRAKWSCDGARERDQQG